MHSTLKQVLWGTGALALVVIGFKLSDGMRKDTAASHAEQLTASIEARSIELAEKDLNRLADIRFYSQSKRRAHLQQLEDYRRKVDTLKSALLLEQTGEDFDRLRASAALGQYNAIRPQLKEMETRIEQAPAASQATMRETHQGFKDWLDELETHRNRIQANLHMEDFWKQPGFDPSPDAMRLRELADLVERHAKAPASKLIGEDRKSVRARQAKLIDKVLEDFHKAHDWTRELVQLDEMLARLKTQADEYLLARESAPETAARLSLKKTKAHFTEKIEQVAAEVTQLKLERTNALDALADMQENLGAEHLPEDPYTPYLDVAYLAAYHTQLLDRLRGLQSVSDNSQAFAGMYIGHVQVLLAYLDRHLASIAATGRVNRSFAILQQGLTPQLAKLALRYEQEPNLDAVAVHQIDGAAVLAFLCLEPPRDERPAKE